MGEVIDNRGRACANCMYYYQPSNTTGHVCCNPESRFVGAWVSEYHKCEDYKERDGYA